MVDFFFQCHLILCFVYATSLCDGVSYSQKTFSHIEEKKMQPTHTWCPLPVLPNNRSFPSLNQLQILCARTLKLESWESINPVSLITRNLTDQQTSPPIVTSKPGSYRFFKAIFSSLLRSTTTETLEMELKKRRVQNAAPVILKSSQPMSSQL